MYTNKAKNQLGSNLISLFSIEPHHDQAGGRGQDPGGLQLRERGYCRHHTERDCGRAVHGNVGKLRL